MEDVNAELTDNAGELAELYGIDTEQVRAAVEGQTSGPTSVLDVDWGESSYAFYVSEPPASYARDDGRYELVALTDRGHPEPKVLSVHVVPWDMLEVREESKPVAMLRKVANDVRYGRGLSMWGHGRQFVSGEVVVPASDDGITVEDSAPGVYLEDRSEWYGDGVRVSLAFAVDTEAVRAGLGLD